MNNFTCLNCKTNFFVSSYSVILKNLNPTYKYKFTGKQIECPDCKSQEISYLEKPGDFKTLELGKYSMLSIPDRQESLKKRSHEHFKREVEEKKRLIDSSPCTQPIV